jgi:hypothetical protein
LQTVAPTSWLPKNAAAASRYLPAAMAGLDSEDNLKEVRWPGIRRRTQW